MDIPHVSVPTLRSVDAASFPVRRIYCVGQNYADHAREMGSDPDRKPPFFFMKPADAVVASGSSLVFPGMTSDLQHEVELVVALGRGGSAISAGAAAALIFGWAVGFDLTRRDLQAEAKRSGRPWDMAKGFDHSAPIGDLVLGVPPAAAGIRLAVNGEVRQSGDVSSMIWNVSEIIANLSCYVELKPGDIVFTGTPAGVGPLQPGDQVCGSIDGAPALEITFLSP